MKAFPEMKLYFNIPESNQSDMDNTYYRSEIYTGRIRERCAYTACLNGYFQGPAADGAKEAGWELIKRGYPIVNFIHDEFIFDFPENEFLTARIEHAKSIMIESMKKITPHVKVGAGAEVMRHWSKGAKEVRDGNGNYIPFEDVINK